MFYDPSLCSINPISSLYIENKSTNADDSSTNAKYMKVNTEVDDDSEHVSTEEDEDMDIDYDPIASKYLYESEILHAFNTTEFDEININTKIEQLYNHIQSIQETNETARVFLSYALQLSLNTLLSNDEYSGFIILFSYHFFHITHLCILELLGAYGTQDISHKNMNSLAHCIRLFINNEE